MNRLFGISVECTDAWHVAQFWERALHAEIVGEATRDRILLELGTGPSALQLSFRRRPARKFLENRMRLDLVAANFEAESARLLSLGAVRLDNLGSADTRRTTFTDIEGNEFALFDG